MSRKIFSMHPSSKDYKYKVTNILLSVKAPRRHHDQIIISSLKIFNIAFEVRI